MFLYLYMPFWTATHIATTIPIHGIVNALICVVIALKGIVDNVTTMVRYVMCVFAATNLMQRLLHAASAC